MSTYVLKCGHQHISQEPCKDALNIIKFILHNKRSHHYYIYKLLVACKLLAAEIDLKAYEYKGSFL